MAKILLYTLFMVGVSFLISSGLLLFVRGFLIYRNISKDKSACRSTIECSNSEDIRIILLIVDALRYDFVKWQNTGFGNPSYTNKMVYLNELFLKNPVNSRLYKFIADPPTTTLQRIKALTTGTYPTFIDAGSNFGTAEIDEDNIIDQIISRNKTIVLVGDDTWSQLFRGRFIRETAYPSLNVWDLDTVDNGVISGFSQELKASDWKLLIGHMLGVDHVGHTFGPTHPIMSAKLKQIDNFIKDVIQRMNNKTVLFIFGDHGMTESGDHGGESDPEITSALIVYSPNSNIIDYFESREGVKQIDIVPTLSQLLAVPIPFSNLGRSLLTRKTNAREHFRDNARQVYSYITKYSKQNTLFRKEIIALKKEYQSLEDKYLSGSPFYINSSISFIELVQRLCQTYWVQFDYYSMTLGTILLLFIILLAFLIISYVPINAVQTLLSYEFFFSWLSLIIVAIFLAKIMHFFTRVYNLITWSLIISILFSLYWILTGLKKYGAIISKNLKIWPLIGQNKYACVFCTLACLANLSNSFVVNEHYVISYLLLGTVWISVFICFDVSRRVEKKRFICAKQRKRITAAFLFTCVLKLSTYYWECREEHGPDCIVNKENSLFSTFVSGASLLCIVVGSKVFFRKYVDKGCSVSHILFKYVSVFCIIGIIGSWTMRKFETGCSANNFTCFMYSKLKSLCTAYTLVTGTVAVLFTLFIFRHYQSLRQTIRNQKYSDQSFVFCLSTYTIPEMLNLVVFTTLLLAVIAGESRAVTIVLCISSLCIIGYIFDPLQDGDCSKHWLFVVVWSLSSWHWFYSTGHQPTFPNIRWNVVELTDGYFGGFLILTETFSSLIAHGILMPVVFIFVNLYNKRKAMIVIPRYFFVRKVLSYTLVQALRVFACVFCVYIHARHLMVWKIFAPKLIFESIGFLLSIPFIIAGFLFINKISHLSMKYGQMK